MMVVGVVLLAVAVIAVLLYRGLGFYRWNDPIVNQKRKAWR